MKDQSDNNKSWITDKTRVKLKYIAKYPDIFDVIFISRFIDYKLIASLTGVSQKTVERAFKDIRSNKYARELIIEVMRGNNIVVFASNSLYRLFNSTLTCDISKKAKKGERIYISPSRRKLGILRVLRNKFKDEDINDEISKALIDSDMECIEHRCIKDELKQSRKFLINETTFQNYKVYEYKFNLIEFCNEIDFGELKFDAENELITADLFCFSNDTTEIVRTYDKALLLLESLRYIDYKDSKYYKIKINYSVITVDKVNIKEYIYKLGKSFRYHNLDIVNNYYYNLNLSEVKNSRWFFKIYKETCEGDTNFTLFSDITGDFIVYGNRY